VASWVAKVPADGWQRLSAGDCSATIWMRMSDKQGEKGLGSPQLDD